MFRLLLTTFLAFFASLTFLHAQPGNALHFDGSNDNVSATLPSLFNNLAANDFTMEAWVYPTGAIFSRIIYAQGSTTNFATMSTGGTNNIYFYVVANGTNYSVATTATLPSNTWTHVAARWTAATLTPVVFFNGVQQAGAGGGTSSTGSTNILSIGTRPGGAQYFPGAIDEVRIWASARTQCAIQANMNRHLTGAQTGLVVNYDFNQGGGGGTNTGITTLPDGSGNGFNGTLNGFALTGATSNWITSAANITSSGNAVGGVQVAASASVCNGDSYTFPDGSSQTNITTQVVQVSTLTASNGCDSVITTTVDVNPNYSLTDTVSVCSGSSYTFPDGSTLNNITSSIIQNSTLQTSAGCDSLIATLVQVLPSSSDSVSALVCMGDSYQFPDGSIDTNITVQVIQTSTLLNASGCDSVIVTTVDVANNYFQIALDSACQGSSYTFPDGFTVHNLFNQVQHTSMFFSIAGCDSFVSTTVDVSPVDTAVINVTATSLTANATGALYQWIDCSTGLPVPGETGQVFNTFLHGYFAVIVTQGGCSDTSACYPILNLASASGMRPTFLAYPNPNQGSFDLQLPEGMSLPVDFEVMNAVGQSVYRGVATQTQTRIHMPDAPAGVYSLRVHMPEGVQALRLVRLR